MSICLFYHQTLQLKRAVGDKRGEANTLREIGGVYSGLSDNQKALEFLNQALPLNRAVGDKVGEGITLNRLGTAYNSLGEKQRALDFYNQALAIQQTERRRLDEAASLQGIGMVYRDLGERQKALDFYNQALPIFRKENDRSDEAVTLISIGIVYGDLGEKQKALDLYNQALPIYRSIGNREGEAMTLGDRVVVMKDGWIQQVGEPLELYGHPANRFVAGFIGSPSMNFVEVTVADANGALWADTPGLRVKVPPASAGRLGPYKGQRVTLGIRPEDLRVATGADSADYSFDTVVEVVEPLGSEILLDLKAGPNVIVARVDPTVRVKHQDKMRLSLHPERVHFFDNKTELAI